MKARPILFSAPMVHALLDGSKTQTRRVSGLHVINQDPGRYTYLGLVSGPGQQHYAFRDEKNGATTLVRCPYGQPGDRLWVREAWRTVAEADALPPRDLTPAHRIWYEADTSQQPGAGKLRPSMFMPRAASRITLEIVSIRVERLQDISEADALAEGCPVRDGVQGSHPTLWYSYLWEAINGLGSWEANPYVWAVEFNRVN